jgi:hypothetical protein
VHEVNDRCDHNDDWFEFAKFLSQRGYSAQIAIGETSNKCIVSVFDKTGLPQATTEASEAIVQLVG